MARRPLGSARRSMRQDLEQILGPAGLDERPVRDLWPLAIMRERSGETAPRVLVARPSNRQQVVAILRWAASSHVAVSPLGGASGVCGALAPQSGELVLDMGAFDRVLEIDETNLLCRVESGVNGLALEKQLNALGLTLGHYPSSLPGTTIGGLISTRSAGQESSRYGRIEAMRSIMQSGIRPLVLRLYDAEDTAFGGHDLAPGSCLMVVAAAGLNEVAQAEAGAIKRFAGSARDLGEAPWQSWRQHRFDLSAERMKALLEPAGSYLDTIEVAARWSVLADLHARVKSAI